MHSIILVHRIIIIFLISIEAVETYSVKDVVRRRFQWSIGTEDRNSICNYSRLCNVELNVYHLEWPYITVLDLMVTTKRGHMELINVFFFFFFIIIHNTTRGIL